MKRNISSLLTLAIILLCSIQTFSQKNTAPVKGDHAKRKMILRDEGLSQLSYIDLADSSKNWYLPVPPGRDLQLVGKGLVLIGTGNGYEEREIATGKKVFEITSLPGTLAARRLRNGNTLISGIDLQGRKGIVLLETDRSGAILHTVAFAGLGYARLVRETGNKTFLITADDEVLEVNFKEEILWRTKLGYNPKPHVWQAVKTGKQTLVSTGYGKTLQRFDQSGKLIDSITGPASVNPHFFAGFQVLQNGNIVVTNWQGHGPKYGASGVQLLEYTPKGTLVWSWKQNPAKFSSLQGVIVLDGLDPNKMYVENSQGKLEAVK